METNYQISRILNMTRNPNEIQLPATRTLEFTGTRLFQSTRITTCGAEKQSFSMSLKSRDGKKFLFKGARFPKDLEAPPRMQVSVHRK